MKKKIAALFLTFVLGIIAYLIIPLPSWGDEEFPKDKPIALIPNEQNKGERCKAQTIYVTKESKQYHDSEGYDFTVDDYCANLQKELVTAIENQNIPQVKDLIAKGANPNTIDRSAFEYNYPVIRASLTDNANLMKLLLDNGADVNQEFSCCMSSSTPLSNAVEYNHYQVAKLLLERGADANYTFKYEKFNPKQNSGNSIIDVAIYNNNTEIVELLTANACKDTILCRAEIRAKRLWYFVKINLLGKKI